jgi:hypothetical protein
MWYLHLLDYFFFAFHTSFTLFNLVGWMFYKTRRLNLITLILTAFSWFVLGIWYGWGYCFCTDWHFDIREQLGYHDQQGSYIRFLILKVSGDNLNEKLVETITLIVFLISLMMSILMNTRDWKQKHGFKQSAKPKINSF